MMVMIGRMIVCFNAPVSKSSIILLVCTVIGWYQISVIYSTSNTTKMY